MNKTSNPPRNNKTSVHTETRHIVIYGYTRQELTKVIKHFEAQLPEFVKITIDSSNLVTKITLTGVNSGVELLRFKMNRFHNDLNRIFSQEVVSTEDKSIAQVLGELLTELDLTVACAESCTGGNIAHRIVQVPGVFRIFFSEASSAIPTM